MRTPVVVPMRWDWLLMLLLIGLFGFIAQVRYVRPRYMLLLLTGYFTRSS